MVLSARNQLPGTVTAIKTGDVMTELTVQLDQGPELVSVITTTSVERLQLAVGSRVTVVIKATEVMIATDERS
jgi:molybdate transport system regulatory protein